MWYLAYDDYSYAAVNIYVVWHKLDVPASLDQHDIALDAAKARLVEAKSESQSTHKKRFEEPRLIWREPLPTG